MERLNGIADDLRRSIRSLSRQKSWTIVVLITLCLGIGANTALFTIVNAVLLRALPYPDAERLVSLSVRSKGVDARIVSDRTYGEWSQSSRSFAALAAYVPTSAVVQGPLEPEIVDGLLATASYFTALAVQPAFGRVYLPNEDRVGGPAVVVLSERLWRRLFGADSLRGARTVLFNGKPREVVGVMPSSLALSDGPEFWMPLQMDPAPTPGSTFYNFVIGRLRPGASIASARAELAILERRLDAGRPADLRGQTPVIMTMRARLHADSRPALLILFGAVGVLLLVACANVCSLLLARGARQQRELAVRQVLGSTRWKLIRYQLIESIVLAFGGAVLGVLLTMLVLDWFVRLAPAQVAGVEGMHVDARVLVFTSIVAVVAGVLFGLIPALESGRVSLASASSDTARATLTGRQRRLGRALIVFELATSVVLLTCAGLLSRSFARVLSIDPGFQPKGVLVARVALPSDRYSAEAAGRFFSILLEQARQLPGVESAALGDVTPLTEARRTITRSDDRGGQSPPIDLVVVSPDYFATVGAPVIRGRDIGREDGSDGQRAVVINATLARLLFGEANAVGQPFDLTGDPQSNAVVVGVVKDILGDLEAAAHPVAFIPASQAAPSTRMNLLLRTRGTVIPLQQSVRTLVHSMDTALPVQRFETLEQSLSEAVAPRRFSFVLLTVFALLAATLAAVGLYGVMAYHVADRTREIGIRTALGAEPQMLLRLVVRQGMTLSLVGITLGLLGSVAAVRLLRHMLFGVSIYDPWTFAAAALLLGLVATIACWMPAQRAANVDPTVALRAE